METDFSLLVSFLPALDIFMEFSYSGGKASNLWMISLAELGYRLLPSSVGDSFKSLSGFLQQQLVLKGFRKIEISNVFWIN